MDPGGQTATEIDALFARVRAGDAIAFGKWMGRVERPIRGSLRRFARAVDAESIMQETLLRMWLLATRGRRELQGADASLRFSIGVARNLALSEARRMGRVAYLPPEKMPEEPQDPPPSPDPGLAAAIRECLDKLTAKLREVLLARIARGVFQHDRNLSTTLRHSLGEFTEQPPCIGPRI